jgi:hypothetical protein
MKQAPEDFNDLCANLALCVADTLDHPDCPVDLADALHEITDELQNAISPSPSELLRALAGLAKARNRETRPEIEKAFVVAPGTKNGHLNGASINSLS